MATVTKGKTFISGETVEPADMHQLVDAATVTNIVDADIGSGAAIAASKLAGTLDLSSKTVTLPDSNIVTAKIADAAVAQAKLAANVAGNGPAFRAYASSTTSLPNNTITKVTLATEGFDTNSNFASSRFTPTVAGYYQISGSVYVLNAPLFLQAILYKNGENAVAGVHTNTRTYLSNFSDVIYLNGTTDYLELYAFHASGGTETVNVNAGGTFLSGFLARAA
jgi:hypothetical protein